MRIGLLSEINYRTDADEGIYLVRINPFCYIITISSITCGLKTQYKVCFYFKSLVI